MGEKARRRVQIPPWPILPDESTGGITPYSLTLSSLDPLPLQGVLPATGSDSNELDLADPPDAAYSDEFRMFEFKVRRCGRVRSHDWTECPFAHPGEKARRRDPRRFQYSGTSCPDFRKGNCKKGDSCEFAHGVFESWLHPARYRTQPCKDGTACRRPVCFFAHTAGQLRVFSGNEPQRQQQRSPRSAGGSPKIADSYDGSMLRRRASLEAYLYSKGAMSSSPTSTLAPAWDSPPVSPVGKMVASMNLLRLTASASPAHLGFVGCNFDCSRWLSPAVISSLPARQTASVTPSGELDVEETNRGTGGYMVHGFDVYSNLRESPEDKDAGVGFPAPDVGWVSELVM